MASKPLTAPAIRSLKLAPDETKEVWHHDGGGLYLRLRNGPHGLARDWMLRYSHPLLPDKRSKLSLGSYPAVSLADARSAAGAARELLAKNIDPKEQREREFEAAKVQAILEHTGAIPTTVGELFVRWRDTYLDRAHSDGGEYTEGIMTRHVLPVIGLVPLADLRAKHIIAMLDAVRKTGLTRTCGVALDAVRQMCRYAVPSEWLQGDPTVGLKKSRWDGDAVEIDRWLSASEIKLLAQAMALSDMSPRWQHAVWLILACGTRAEETILAEVRHFTLEPGASDGRWLIPAANQKKTRRKTPLRDFDVGLSPFARQQVEALIALSPAPASGAHYVFPGRGNGSHANEKSLTHKIEDRQRITPLNGRKCTTELVLPGGPWAVHDLRRSTSSHMGELGISQEIVDLCLNHSIKGKVTRTYQRSPRFSEMSAAWMAVGEYMACLKAEAEADPDFQQKLAAKLKEDKARGERYAIVKARRLARASELS